MTDSGAEQYATVIGDWKSFTFQIATVEDGPAIVQYLGAHYITQEPINLHLGGGEWNSDRAADTRTRIQPELENGLSVYVTLKDSKEIIALNLVSDSRQPSPIVGKEPRSPITRKLLVLISMMKESTESALESEFKCDHYAEISWTSVHPNWFGHGIATEMIERTLQLLKAKGYPVVTADFSHAGTKRIGQKLGFEELRRYYFTDIVDENGMKLFLNAQDDEFVVSVAKVFN